MATRTNQSSQARDSDTATATDRQSQERDRGMVVAAETTPMEIPRHKRDLDMAMEVMDPSLTRDMDMAAEAMDLIPSQDRDPDAATEVMDQPSQARVLDLAAVMDLDRPSLARDPDPVVVTPTDLDRPSLARDPDTAVPMTPTRHTSNTAVDTVTSYEQPTRRIYEQQHYPTNNRASMTMALPPVSSCFQPPRTPETKKGLFTIHIYSQISHRHLRSIAVVSARWLWSDSVSYEARSVAIAGLVS